MAITPTDTLRYETEGRKAIITLTRPEAMNALNREILNAIGEAVHEYEHDDNLLVAIITGEGGRAFSAGYDLKEFAEATGEVRGSQDMPWEPMVDYAWMKGNTEKFMSLFRSHKPTIAKVHGYAVAGGSDIALCCDLVVMA